MKKFIQVAAMLLLLTTIGTPLFVLSQSSSKDSKLIGDCSTSKAEFIKVDSKIASLFEKSAGYVIFPNVGKGAVGIGGAAGNGILYVGGTPIGKASMKQVNIGFQFGGQAYREVIFFEDAATLDNFKKNKFEFTAQASAIAAKSGASADAKYKDGVLVFTQGKGGLMYEAAIGGQKFNFKAY